MGMTVALPSPRPRVMLLGGSRGQPSRTRGLLDAAASRLRAHGARVDLWDIGAGANGASAGRRDPRVFRALAGEADAFVIATPTYHGSYSGLIKHALDLLDKGCFEGKPVGLMCTCGGARSPQAVDHLRIVIRALHGTAIPTQVIATESDFRRLADRYELRDQGSLREVARFVDELNWFAERFKAPAPRTPPLAPRPPVPALMAGDEALWLDEADFPEQITRAIRYIRENFSSGGLTLDAVARQAYMSRFHFSRSFKQATGTRFMDFLRTVRLAEACELLARSDQPVTSIAFGVGYRDLSHFERVFKKEFGYPPSEYRARVQAGLERPLRLPWNGVETAAEEESSAARA
jgi:AraC-like DNA-binding protein/NAD(P)H-dependent FMN reductase